VVKEEKEYKPRKLEKKSVEDVVRELFADPQTGITEGEVSKRIDRYGKNAVVVATGKNARFARTVELVAGTEEASHFQRAILRIGYFLIVSAGALVVSRMRDGAGRGLQVGMSARLK
jgi:magnesium-transporting ATPase (P-type)